MDHIRGIEHRWILSQEVAEIEKFRHSWHFSRTPSSPMDRQAAARSRFEYFVTRRGESRPTTSSAAALGRCFLCEWERGDWRCLEVVGLVESNRQLSSATAAGRCFLCKSGRGDWRCLEVVGLVEANRQFSSATAAGRCFLCKSGRGDWR
jgi:hypothetical protein